MAKRFAPGFIATEEQGARIQIIAKGNDWEAHYSPASDAVALVQRFNEDFAIPNKPVILAKGDRDGKRVVFMPRTLDAASPYFLKPRYETLRTITMVGFGFWVEIEDLDSFRAYLADMPTGFVRDPFFGLGIAFEIRQIVSTIERLGVTDLRITKGARGEAKLDGKSYDLPAALFDTVRRDIGRVHDKALSAARAEKIARTHDKLLTPIDPKKFEPIGQPYAPGDLVRAVGDGLRRGMTVSPADADTLVEATASMIGEVAQREPAQLLKLTEAVETVTLEAMIAHMRARIKERHGEGDWQKFFVANAFILRLAFGVPVLLFQSQATVGGRTYDGSGDKRTDFLMKAAETGNLSIVEIKTPQTELLAKKEYRGGIFAPDPDLTSAVAQVLDQRWHLQQNNRPLADDHRRKAGTEASSRGPGPEVYAVQCVVVAGRSPIDPNQQKSFELYRNSLTGVLVLTYDELLRKLEALHQILKNPDASTLRVPTVTVKRPRRSKPPGARPRR